MKKYCTTMVLLIAVLHAGAQLKPFDASLISKDLIKHAGSVKREERIELDVRSTEKAYYKVHKVITIFNQEEIDELQFECYADQFHSLEDASIRLLDADGAVIHKYSKSDLNKMAYGGGLVPDGKLYFTQLKSSSYPVTMVTDY